MKLKTKLLSFCLLISLLSALASGEDFKKLAIKAVEKSTLDQPGTHPFHLKATYAPTLERDKDLNRNGEIEIWWQSPTRWRRELNAPGFHQVAIVDGNHMWQKNEGDFFPEWLRELTIALVRPVPFPIERLETKIKSARQINFDWDPVDGPGDMESNAKGHMAIDTQTGLLLYAGGLGWTGLYKNYQDFHGRMIARTVLSGGHIELTAQISTLENLGDVPTSFFDATAPGGDPPIESVVLDEAELRKNLLPGSQPFVWPPVQNGPFEGVVWTQVVLDRSGKVRELLPPIADNPGMKDAAEEGFRSMQFAPIIRNGVPVQALGKLSEKFKTMRPEGSENFDSARNYFAHTRKLDFLPAGSTSPYTLHADFVVGTSAGPQTGRYQDSWLQTDQWRREAGSAAATWSALRMETSATCSQREATRNCCVS